MRRGASASGARCIRSGRGPEIQLTPFSTGFFAFSHPAIPAGMMNTFLYPSLTAARAASWHASHFSLAQ